MTAAERTELRALKLAVDNAMAAVTAAVLAKKTAINAMVAFKVAHTVDV